MPRVGSQTITKRKQLERYVGTNAKVQSRPKKQDEGTGRKTAPNPPKYSASEMATRAKGRGLTMEQLVQQNKQNPSPKAKEKMKFPSITLPKFPRPNLPKWPAHAPYDKSNPKDWLRILRDFNKYSNQ